jgi:hypothetical protein
MLIHAHRRAQEAAHVAGFVNVQNYVPKCRGREGVPRGKESIALVRACGKASSDVFQ